MKSVSLRSLMLSGVDPAYSSVDSCRRTRNRVSSQVFPFTRVHKQAHRHNRGRRAAKGQVAKRKVSRRLNVQTKPFVQRTSPRGPLVPVLLACLPSIASKLCAPSKVSEHPSQTADSTHTHLIHEQSSRKSPIQPSRSAFRLSIHSLFRSEAQPTGPTVKGGARVKAGLEQWVPVSSF